MSDNDILEGALLLSELAAIALGAEEDVVPTPIPNAAPMSFKVDPNAAVTTNLMVTLPGGSVETFAVTVTPEGDDTFAKCVTMASTSGTGAIMTVPIIVNNSDYQLTGTASLSINAT